MNIMYWNYIEGVTLYMNEKICYKIINCDGKIECDLCYCYKYQLEGLKDLLYSYNFIIKFI